MLDGIEKVARREILRDFRQDSCIGSTRVVIRVLRHFGYKAEPLPVKLYVFNEAYARLLEAGKMPPEDEKERQEWLDTHKAWSVGVGFLADGRPDKIRGHVVALLRREKLIVDASIDQATRPQHKIFLPGTLVVPVTEDFLDNKDFVVGDVNRCVLKYETCPDERQFLKARDWTDLTRTGDATRSIIAYIQEAQRGTTT